jgi:uncharacterized protein (DUF2062 family)
MERVERDVSVTLPRICVVIPVYNHGLTVQRVVRGAKARLPVIVVNDGSTDDTAKVLAAEAAITVVALPRNQGKAAALRAGFEQAGQMGFTHVITIDADGQHSTDALPDFVAACQHQPEAFIIGVRDLKSARAPFPRRFSNELSTFWFKFETGVRLSDTQCGYRCYPLAGTRALAVRSERYAFELEIMVKAAWAGIPLVPLPVQADYAAPTSRLSHFDPARDFLRISHLHSRLAMQAFCVPAPLRALSARGDLRALPRRQRLTTVLRHFLAEHTETPARLASAVGLGFFCGIAPIWGFQMAAAAALAHRCRLNKAIALAASNISFPLAAPFILAGGLLLGHFLHTGQWLGWHPASVARDIPVYLGEWIIGSLGLAVLAGALGWLATWCIARIFTLPSPALRDD